MAAFQYELHQDRNNDGEQYIYAISWNDCQMWICKEESDYEIWNELYSEMGYKITFLDYSAFNAKVRQALGLS